MAPGSSKLQPIGPHRSVRNGRAAGHAVAVACAFSVWLCKASAGQFSRTPLSARGHDIGRGGRPSHIVAYVPAPGAQWLFANLRNALVLNVILAIFNLLPIPPLDGGRILVGVLPGAMARSLSRFEPFGLLILIGLLFVLPVLGSQLGINLDPISRLLLTSTNAIVGVILWLTGNI
jgi:Zn-dependent protease